MPRTFEKRRKRKELKEAAKGLKKFLPFESLPAELKIVILSTLLQKCVILREKRGESNTYSTHVNLMLMSRHFIEPVQKTLYKNARLSISLGDLFPRNHSNVLSWIPTSPTDLARLTWRALTLFQRIRLSIDDGFRLLRHEKQAAEILRTIASSRRSRPMVDLELVVHDPVRTFHDRPFTYFCMFQTIVTYVKCRHVKVTKISAWGPVSDDLGYYCRANNIELHDTADSITQNSGPFDHIINWAAPDLLDDDVEGPASICCLFNGRDCQHGAEIESEQFVDVG